MTIYAAVYFNGELLCITNHTGYPSHLGESLESTISDWRSILSICKYYGFYYINAKFFLIDPKFVYNFLDKHQRKKFLEEYPDGPNSPTIKNANEFFEKYDDFGLEYIDDELYTIPCDDPNPEYHYNHQNNRVFVRYPMKNFPWILVEQAKDLDRSELDEIRYDMCGFLGHEDIDYDILNRVYKSGPISSGRHLLRACKEATELLPRDPNSWWNYAIALELAGKLDQAFECYEKATELTPTNPKIWFFFGNAYLRNNYQEKAHETFKIAISYLKNLDFLKMDYEEKEIIQGLYKTIVKQFEDLAKKFSESVHSGISLKENEFLDTIQKQIKKLFYDYESEKGHIIKLRLHHLNLSSLPESIGLLTSLEELDLSKNWLTSLPVEMGNLSSLKRLNLKLNKFHSHPDWLKKIEHLEIDPIPPEIAPKEKEVMELIEKEIGEPLPIVLEVEKEKLGYVVRNNHVIELSLHSNYPIKAISIPESIKLLKSLQILKLHWNKLETLPKWLGAFDSLEDLYLSCNKLTELPTSICSLSSLKKLEIHCGYITELPASIGSLMSLKTLYLNTRKVTNLPESIINLTNLENLTIVYCGFELLPEVVYSLTSLKKLHIESNLELENFESLKKFKFLQELRLSGGYKEVPESIKFLTSLKKLDLGWNKLETLPEWLSTLESLECLKLYKNDFNSLPEVLYSLTSLEELDIGNNERLILANLFKTFESLKVLIMHSNKLKEVPESIKLLTSLKKLDLGWNKLEILPEWLGTLKFLEELILPYNLLTKLPASIGSLTSLKKLDLRGSKFLDSNSISMLEHFKKIGVTIVE